VPVVPLLLMSATIQSFFEALRELMKIIPYRCTILESCDYANVSLNRTQYPCRARKFVSKLHFLSTAPSLLQVETTNLGLACVSRADDRDAESFYLPLDEGVGDSH
jgi:hypothetical protein